MLTKGPLPPQAAFLLPARIIDTLQDRQLLCGARHALALDSIRRRAK
jgi:hypothetical protein